MRAILAGIAVAAVIAPGLAYADHGVRGRVDYAASKIGKQELRLTQRHGGAYTADTALYAVKLADGATVHAYCLDLAQKAVDRAPMVEAGYDEHPTGNDFQRNSSQVNWILQNSYPKMGLAAFSGKVGKGLTPDDAVRGTQAAIWHYTDGITIAPQDNNAATTAVYSYLTGAANTGVPTEPKAALTLDTPTRPQDGSRIGPITLHTTSEGPVPVTLTEAPAGAKLVDAQGKPVTALKDGQQAFVSIPTGATAGSATITARGKAVLPAGRMLVQRDQKTQTLAAASDQEINADTAASVSWTGMAVANMSGTSANTGSADNTGSTGTTTTQNSAGASSLPVTGVALSVAATAGVILLALGVTAIIVVRRRRRLFVS
ncbi:thioester domain-containing protein [Longispora albida]|uniref:thioester domain-containing protein n=1 Tax=Longispora albida TaxID=203523 RepID=UPI00037E60F5|nr:thioester domain-containing protein [Longispora albida]